MQKCQLGTSMIIWYTVIYIGRTISYRESLDETINLFFQHMQDENEHKI